MGHIGAFAVENVSERGMPIVTWAADHRIFSVDLSREQNAIAIERQVGIFKLIKLIKIISVGHPDRRAMIPVAPCHIKPVLYPANTGIVAIYKPSYFGVITYEPYRFRI